MKRFGTHLLGTVLVFVNLLLLSSCAQIKLQPTKTAEGPAPKFVLSASGLAESGIWKCTPVLVDINRDGHLDMLAINRLETELTSGSATAGETGGNPLRV